MADASTMEGGKRGGKWLTHVKKTMKAHKGMPFGKVLKLAKKTYKGGAAEPYAPASAAKTASPVGGRRTRRGTRRSRKH